MKLNPEMFQLFRKEVRYLSHIVSPSGVTTDPKNLEAMKSWPRTIDTHQLRSFLVLCTYYRRFISGFANIAQLLTRLTEEKRTFEWTTEAETAFQLLKEVLCTAPVLGYWRPEDKFIVDTDTNNVGIRAVVSQVQDGRTGCGLLQQNSVQGRKELLCDP